MTLERFDPKLAINDAHRRDLDHTLHALLKARGVVSEASVRAPLAKAAVDPTLRDPDWFGPRGAFLASAYELMVFGRMPGVHQIDFVREARAQVAGAGAAFVREGGRTPVSKAGFGNLALRRTKVAALAAASSEFADGEARAALMRSAIARAVAQAVNAKALSSDAPDEPATFIVRLFQEDMLALGALLSINWQLLDGAVDTAGNHAVISLTGASYA